MERYISCAAPTSSDADCSPRLAASAAPAAFCCALDFAGMVPLMLVEPVRMHGRSQKTNAFEGLEVAGDTGSPAAKPVDQPGLAAFVRSTSRTAEGTIRLLGPLPFCLVPSLTPQYPRAWCGWPRLDEPLAGVSFSVCRSPRTTMLGSNR